MFAALPSNALTPLNQMSFFSRHDRFLIIKRSAGFLPTVEIPERLGKISTVGRNSTENYPRASCHVERSETSELKVSK